MFVQVGTFGPYSLFNHRDYFSNAEEGILEFFVVRSMNISAIITEFWK